jgi:hypothetical protein
MKSDTQHLDFLISQYVDGCLDASSKKSIEQKLLNDPEARKLYTDHRETQDLLDDWGNRIPMINWDDFDQKLAARLEKETVGSDRGRIFRRWARPAAVAASLFIAAGIGYSVHLLSDKPVPQPNIIALPAPTPTGDGVHFPDYELPHRSAHREFDVVEQLRTAKLNKDAVTISAPDATAAVPTKESPGLPSLPGSVDPHQLGSPSSGTSMAVGLPGETKKEKDTPPAFP